MNAFYVDEYLIVFSPFHSSLSCSKVEEQTQLLSPIVFIFFSIFSICVVSIFVYKKLKKSEQTADVSDTHNPKFSPSTIDRFDQNLQNKEPRSLFLEILNSNSPTKLNSIYASLSSNSSVGENGEARNERHIDGSESEKDGGNDLVDRDCAKSGKKKKKRSKKTRRNLQSEDGKEISIEGGASALQHKHSLEYPFTSSSSATQRKIKQQYDQLVKSNVSKGLTMTQVGEFVNCLVEARNVLQHKSEVIQRKFTITKALLLKADRSSFDRLSQQLYKLEAEQKRVEEDASVYNRLQQQLKLSPAYKKMLEVGARLELKASSDQLADKTDTDLPDISFEELLAREKKDTFWQKNGKMRSCMN